MLFIAPRPGRLLRALVFLAVMIGPLAGADARPSGESWEDVFERCAEAVFEVRVRGVGGVIATGTGFLIDSDGTAVTNYHVVEGAAGAEAHFPRLNRTTALELVKVVPELDLAFVRVPARLFVGSGPVPLIEFAQREPSPGSEVGAIGFPHELGLSLTRGLVSGLRQSAELPDAFKAMKLRSPRAKWVQTDCAINCGNSGGPLVDRAGRLVGVNTWTYRGTPGLHFALAAAEVQGALPAADEEPVGFAKAQAQHRTQPRSRAASPRLVVPDRRRAIDVMQRLASARKGIFCGVCDGAGKLKVEKRVGTERRRDGMMWPIFRTEIQACKSCAGTAFRESQRVHEAACRVASEVAAVSLQDDRLMALMDKLRELWTECLAAAPERFATMVNDESHRVINRPDAALGTPLCIVGQVAKRVERAGGEPALLVLLGRRQISFLVEDVLFSEAAPGQRVVVTGLFAGVIRTEDADRVPVLQRATCIVPRN